MFIANQVSEKGREHMKILHVHLCGPYNDDWGYQENLIPKYNKREGHDVSIITSVLTNSKKHEGYETVAPGEYFSKEGVRVIRLPFKKSILLRSLVTRLRIYDGLYERIEEEKPDFIFMHGLQFWDIDKVVKYVKNNPRVRLVADNHATYDNSAKNFLSKKILHPIIWKKKIQKALPYIDKVFVLAPACKEFCIDMYNIPEEKMEYLFLGADTDKIDFQKKEEIKASIRKKLNIEMDDFVLITGGKLSKGKNTKLIVDALKKIDSKKVKLVIFGAISDDIKDELMEKISQDNRIRYIGWLSGDDVYNYYLASDLAVFPGTKSALWEQAIACGLPIICKKWKGMEYVDVGGNCMFLEKEDDEVLAENIKLLMSDKEKYNKMAEVSRTKGYDTFSYEKISRRAIFVTYEFNKIKGWHRNVNC